MNVTFLGVKTYSDPSYIFSGGHEPPRPQVVVRVRVNRVRVWMGDGK